MQTKSDRIPLLKEETLTSSASCIPRQHYYHLEINIESNLSIYEIRTSWILVVNHLCKQQVIIMGWVGLVCKGVFYGSVIFSQN